VILHHGGPDATLSGLEIQVYPISYIRIFGMATSFESLC